mgnify:FL=1
MLARKPLSVLTTALVLSVSVLAACSGERDSLSELEGERTPSVERSVGFDGNVVRLGVIADITGPGGTLDRARLTGVETYWSDVNTQGGLGGRYVVELDILDHRGDPQIAEQAAPGLLEKVVALTFVNETATGAVHPFLVAEQALGVVPTSTLDWENDPRFLTHVPPIEAVVLALFENQPSPNWCVITDGSPIGIATRNASMRAAEVAQAQNVTLIEVGEDLNSATSAVACGKVLVEVAGDFQIEAIDSLPANREIYVRAGSAAAMGRTDLQFAYLDSGPAWNVDSSEGMRLFLAALLRHAPDVQPDTRVRDGYVSQIRLHQLLEQAVAEGDLRRPTLFAASESQAGIDMLGLAEQRLQPRNFNIWFSDNQGDVSDQRGWQLEGQLVTENVDALTN